MIGIRARLITGRNTLPAGYVEYRYIKGDYTGGASPVLLSDYVPNLSTKIRLKVKTAMVLHNTSPHGFTDPNFTFVAHPTADRAWTENCFGLTRWTYQNNSFYISRGISGNTGISIAPNSEYEIEITQHAGGTIGFAINGTGHNLAGYPESSLGMAIAKGLPLYGGIIYNHNGTVNKYLYHTGRLYYYRIYEGDTLVRDFVPCKSPDGTFGMYDLVTGRFFASATAVAFKGGID